jgi:hypothetical protein
MKRASVLVLFALVLPGCLEKAPVSPDPLLIERLTPTGRAYHSGLRDPLRVVVRDAAGLETLWKLAYGDESTGSPLPEVDFETHLVLAVALGERPTGGYAIRVGEVVPVADGLEARIEVTAPGRACAVSLAFTQPVDFVALPVRTGTVRFVDVPRIMQCP